MASNKDAPSLTGQSSGTWMVIAKQMGRDVDEMSARNIAQGKSLFICICRTSKKKVEAYSVASIEVLLDENEKRVLLEDIK